MAIKVYKYGALPPAQDSSIRIQMTWARRYYNDLVEAENARRAIAWGADRCPLPPAHEHPETGKCAVCDEHYKPIRDKYFALEPLDLKPFRAAASAGGLYWGSYLLVEQDFAAAWKKTKPTMRVRYRSWRDSGTIGVQIQAVRTPAGFMRIVDQDDHRTGRRAKQRRAIQIRIGTSIVGKPTWSDPLKIEMHRPIEGRVRWVRICMSYRGEREIWSAAITCDEVPAAERGESGHVAIDVGWRMLPTGYVRLAYAHGSDGQDHELTLSPRWLEAADRADRIRAERGRRLEELKAADPRFAAAKHRYAVQRIMHELGLDDNPEMVAWIKREIHLAEYEIGCRRHSVAHRRDTLAVWMCQLRKLYKTAIIKDSSHKMMKTRKKAIADGIPQPARRRGHHAAPGEIIESVCRAFGRDEHVAVVHAPMTTATCHVCGDEMDIDGELMVRCERCDADYDRDIVSTRNMERLYQVGEIKKPTARKTTARFAKRHKNSSSRKQCQPNG